MLHTILFILVSRFCLEWLVQGTQGANSHGQLGLGHLDDQLLPREVTLEGSPIKAILGGGGHTLCILDDGTLLSCGSNDKGQLGHHDLEHNLTLTPGKVGSTGKVSKAVGGWDFTVVLDDDGNVYTMGSNAFGQLGRKESQEVQGRVEFPLNTKVTDIASGLRHCAATTDDGAVYCWGAGRKGQLGIHDDGKTPSKVLQPRKDTGQLVCWGDNRHGQTAQDPSAVAVVTTPYILPSTLFDGDVVNIYTGWTHNLAITIRGTVYSWGRADYGQLGRETTKSHDFVPQPIRGLGNVTSISCGSEHNLISTEDGGLFAWGWNEHGICGTGDEVNVQMPQQVAALSSFHVNKVGCGAGHSFAVCSGKR